MSELSPEARALLAETRDGDDPSERDRARVRQRLSMAIAAAATSAAASAAAPAAATATTSAATSAASTAATAGTAAAKAGVSMQVAAGAQAVVASGVSAKVGIAVTVAVIGVAGSGVVLKHELAPAKSTRESAAVVEAPRARARKVASVRSSVVPPIEAPAPIIEPAPMIEAPVPDEVPASASPAPVAAPSKPVAPLRGAKPAPKLAPVEPTIPASMQDEIRLISLAQAALRDGEHDRVLSLLGEHASRFPHGTLALERDAVRAIALCESGRTTAGRIAAGELAPRIAGSPLAARVARACDDEEETEP